MKTLLWKDYRENRKVLMAIAIFVLIPYVISAVAAIADLCVDREVPWMQLLWGGSATALYLSAGVTSFIAGNAIAGERADRSAEFAAYLPIPRRSAVASKAIVAISACFFFVMINYGINQAAALTLDVGTDLPLSPMLLAVATAIFMFGVSWLSSSLSSSPVISAASGVAAFLVLSCICLFGMAETSRTAGGFPWTWLSVYVSTCLIAGVGCFVAGVIRCLRRVEP